MGEFFRGWRRKLGVATLVLACIFAAGWIRSEKKMDCGGIGIGRSLFNIGSWDGMVIIDLWSPGQTLPIFLFGSTTCQEYAMIYPPGTFVNTSIKISGMPLATESRLFGKLTFGCRAKRIGLFTVSLPYWSIVIPLTLLSAYLLLSKPRASKPLSNGVKELGRDHERPRRGGRDAPLAEAPEAFPDDRPGKTIEG